MPIPRSSAVHSNNKGSRYPLLFSAVFLLLLASFITLTKVSSSSGSGDSCFDASCYGNTIKKSGASNFWPLSASTSPIIGKKKLQVDVESFQQGLVEPRLGPSPTGGGSWALNKGADVLIPSGKYHSLALWIKPETSGAILSQSNFKNNNYWSLDYQAGRINLLSQRGRKANVCASGQAISPGEWALVEIRFGSNPQIQINGQMAPSCQLSLDSSAPMRLGALTRYQLDSGSLRSKKVKITNKILTAGKKDSKALDSLELYLDKKKPGNKRLTLGRKILPQKMKLTNPWQGQVSSLVLWEKRATLKDGELLSKGRELLATGESVAQDQQATIVPKAIGSVSLTSASLVTTPAGTNATGSISYTYASTDTVTCNINFPTGSWGDGTAGVGCKTGTTSGSWTRTLGNNDGLNYLCVRAGSTTWSTGMSTCRTVRRDSTAPTASVTCSPASPLGFASWYYAGQNPTCTFSGSDSGSGVSTVQRSWTGVGGPWTTTTNGGAVAVPEGSNTVAVRVTDAAGLSANNLWGSNPLKYDNTLPTATITGCNSGSWYTSAPTCTFTASDSNGLWTTTGFPQRCVNGGSCTSNVTSGTTWQPPQGDNSITYTVYDNAGNARTATQQVKLDSVAPGAPTVGSQTSSTTSSSVTVATASAGTDASPSSGGLTVQCTVSGQASGSCTPGSAYSFSGGYGTYTFTFRTRDTAGNLSSEIIRTTTYSQPIVAPGQPVFSSGPSGNWYTSTSASFGWSSTNTSLVLTGWDCKINTGSWSSCGGTSSANPAVASASFTSSNGIQQGSNTLEVRASNSGGLYSATPNPTRTWGVDSVAPAPSITGCNSGTWYTSAPTCTLSATDATSGLSTLQRSTDNTNWTTITNNSTWTAPEGTTTLYLRATDTAGNQATSSQQIQVDSTAPAAPNITAQPASLTNSTSASFSFTGEANATFRCSMNNATYANATICTSPQSYSSLSPGSNTFRVWQVDQAGNPSATAASYTWTIDTTAPTATWSGTPSSPNKNTSVTYTISFGENVTGIDATDFNNQGSATGCVFDPGTDSGSSRTVTISSCSEGTLQPRFLANRATDAAGNTGPAAAADATQITLDRTGPAVQSFAATNSPTNGNTVDYSVTFSESISGFTSAGYSLSGTSGSVGSWSKTEPSNTTGNTWTFSVTNTSATSGTVVATIASGSVTDAATNTGPASSQAATGTIDKDVPVSPNITAQPDSLSNSTSASFSFTGEASATFRCSINDPDYADAITCTSPASYTNLSAGSNTFRVWQVDQAGNPSASPASYTWTIDNTAPTVTWSNAPSSPNKNTSVTYTISFGENVTGVDSTDFSNQGTATGCSFDPGNDSGSSRTVTISSCSEGTLQPRFAANGATDAAGNTGPSSAADGDQITLDRTAPAAPTLSNTYGNTNDTTPTWAWTGAEAGGSYQCKIDNDAWAACSSPHTVAALTEGEHTFRVRQIDDAGNVGEADIDNIAVDPFGVDTTAPSVTAFSATNSPTNGNTVNYSVTFSESISGFTSADYSLSGTSGTVGTWSKTEPSNTTGNTWTFSVTNTSATSGTVIATIDSGSVTDAATNTGPASSQAATGTVDKAVPTATWSGTPSSPNKNTSVTYTIDFGEAVTGIDSADFSNQGTATDCSFDPGNDSGSSRTVTISSCSEGTLQPRFLANRATDAAGNTGPAAAADGGTITIDRTAPDITSFTATNSPTNGNTINYSVTFSESISGFTSADYSLSGTSGSVGTWIKTEPSNTTGNTWTFSVTNTSATSGTVVATIASGSVTDAATNTGPASSQAATGTVDKAVPTATWSNTPSSPNKNTSVTYTISFGENVTGIDATDFNNQGTATGCSFNPGTDSGSSRTVTISSCSEGTLQPRFAANGATDAAGNTGPAAAADGIQITLDRTAPTATWSGTPSSPNKNTSVSYTIDFGEAVTGIDSADFNNQGTATGCSFNPGADSGSSRAVNISSCSEGTLQPRFLANRATDAAENTGPASAVDGAQITLDRTAPSAPTITAQPTDPSNSGEASFSFEGELNAAFRCTINDADFTDATTCASPKSYTGLPDGSQTFRVWQIDAAGNPSSSPAVYTWQITSVALPNLTLEQKFGQDDPTSQSPVQFTFSSDKALNFSTIDKADFTITGGAFPENNWISPTTNAQSYTLNVTPSGQGAVTIAPATANPGPAFSVSDTEDMAQTVIAGGIDRSVTYDTTAPASANITAQPNDPSNSASASFTFDGEPNATFRCAINDADFADSTTCTSPASYSNLPDGSNTFRVWQIDQAGNAATSPASYTWVIDTSAPSAPTIGSPKPNDPSASSAASFSFSGEQGATFKCSINDADFADANICNSPKSYSDLADGSQTFRVWQIDTAGNPSSSPASYTWQIDTNAPNTSIETKPSDPSNSTSASFTFSSNEVGATFECKLDQGSWTTCASPKSYSGLSEGSHSFEVRAIDAAGNTDASPASYTWAVDATAPTAPTLSNPPDAKSPAEGATFSWSGSEGGGSYECKLDEGSWASCSSPKSYTLETLGLGEHVFQVRQVDAAGNPGSAARHVWIVGARETVSLSSLGSQSQSIVFDNFFNGRQVALNLPENTSIAGTLTVTSYEKDPASEVMPVWPVPVSGFRLGAEPVYFTFAKSGDFQLGNSIEICLDVPSGSFQSGTPTLYRNADISGSASPWAQVPNQTYTAGQGGQPGKVCAPITDFSTYAVGSVPGAPTITAAPSGPTSETSASFSFTGDASGTTFQCKLDGAEWENCASPKSYNNLADGSRTFQVRQSVLDSNAFSSPSTHNWTIDTTAPSAPTITAPEIPEFISTTSATVYFSGEVGASFKCALKTPGGITPTYAQASTCASSSSYALSNLQNGAYSAYIWQADQVGNVSQPAVASFTVDIDLPEVGAVSCQPDPADSSSATGENGWFLGDVICSADLSSSAATITSANFEVSENASCNSWTSVGGTLQGSGNQKTAKKNLQTSGKRCLRVKTTNAAGGQSETSAAVEVKIDRQNPSLLQASTPPTSPTSGEVLFTAATLQDTTSLPGSLLLQYRPAASSNPADWAVLPGAACAEQSLASSSETQNGASCIVDTAATSNGTPLLPDGEYQLRLVGKDRAGRQIATVLDARPNNASKNTLIIRNSIALTLPTAPPGSGSSYSPVAPESGSTGSSALIETAANSVEVAAGGAWTLKGCVSGDAPSDRLRSNGGESFPTAARLEVLSAGGPGTPVTLGKGCGSEALLTPNSKAPEDEPVEVSYRLLQDLPWSVSSGDYQLPLSFAASQEINIVAPQEAPANISLPTITGVQAVGQELSVTTGTWSNKPSSFAYQWQRCEQASGGSCTNIGSNSANYTLQAADGGKFIQVQVTASNALGSANATSARSGAVQP